MKTLIRIKALMTKAFIYISSWLVIFLLFQGNAMCQPLYDDVVKEYKDIIEESPQDGHSLVNFSNSYYRYFPRLAREAVLRADKIALTSRDKKLQMEVYLALNNVHTKLDKRDSGIYVLQVLLDMARSSGDLYYELEAMRDLYAHYKRIEMDEQLDGLIPEIRSILSKNITDDMKATAFLLLNNYFGMLENHDSAQVYLDSAEIYLTEQSDPDMYSKYLNDRAVDMFIEGDTHAALDIYFKLIDDDDIDHAKDEAYHNAVMILSWMGRLNDADSLSLLSLEMAMERNRLSEILSAYYDRTKILEELGDYQKAFESYEQMDIYDDSLFSVQTANAVAETQIKYDLSKRDAELKIQRSQRNFFLALTLLLIIVISTSVFIYTNRLRINRKIADQRIAKLEKEKEVLNLQSMLFAQEDERQRIARDLHDSIGALLSAAKLHLSNIENELKNLTNISFLKSTEHVIDQAGKEVRRVAHDMMPGVLMKLGLIEGIDDFLESVRESGKTTLSFTHDQLKKRLDKKQEVMIFRIVQELVNNTMKHAEASEIKLMIHQNGTELILEYRDNGKGFYADLLQSENSFGLSGISARVNFLNGIMRLETSEGNGVHFLISIPLSVEKNETA